MMFRPALLTDMRTKCLFFRRGDIREGPLRRKPWSGPSVQNFLSDGETAL